MMAAEGELIRKRKTSGFDNGGKSMYLLFRSICGVEACGIFELKIPITTKQSSSDDDDDGGFVFIGPAAGDEQVMLQKVQIFVNQPQTRNFSLNSRVGVMSCAPLSNESYLLVPNECSRYKRTNPDAPRVPSLKFNRLTNETIEIPNFPNYRKASPYVASVNNKVYVISYYTDHQNYTGDSTFESFDPQTNVWQSLETPPFYELPHYWNLAGYAVFYNYIIFAVRRTHYTYRKKQEATHPLHAYYSYNTLSGEWKAVHTPSPGVYCAWKGEAVVIGDAIYGIIRPAWTLAAFRCSVKECGTLFLDSPVKVQGWIPYISKYGDTDPFFAIGKIGDRLFCHITNILPSDEGNQPVTISFYYIYKLECCRLLGSSIYHFPRSQEFKAITICSCLTWEPSGDHGNHNELHRDKRAREEHEVKDSEVEMMESNMAIDVPEIVM